MAYKQSPYSLLEPFHFALPAWSGSEEEGLFAYLSLKANHGCYLHPLVMAGQCAFGAHRKINA